MACSAAPASASLSDVLGTCAAKDADQGAAGDNLPFLFCDDGVPAQGGTTPNPPGVGAPADAVPVPAKYTSPGNPVKDAVGSATVPGANSNGDVALDVDVSLPDQGKWGNGPYPVVVMMHGCCSGNKTSWEAEGIDGGGAENWHYNNAWFAARGYAVLTYTSRGFVNGSNQGSTGQTQLDSDIYEINDYQHLAGQLADLPDVNPGATGNQTVDPERIVPTGGSYGGGFTWLALTDPTWDSPGGKDMKVVAAATKYGWTNLVESLVPRGDDRRDALPETDPEAVKSQLSTTPGFPKRTINAALYGSGLAGVPPGNHTTFAQDIHEAQACLTAPPDPGPPNAACANTRTTTLGRFIDERSAFYQQSFFDGLANNSIADVPVFSAGTFTDKLFPAAEHRRMVERLKDTNASYPVQEYYGDYNHFVQTKRKEFADVCGDDVCGYEDYPSGNLNAVPNGRSLEPGVTSRLNRFIDHYAKPPANTGEPAPSFDVTGALQVCPGNASSLGRDTDEPGPRFTASEFAALAPNSLQVSAPGTQVTTNPVPGANAHAKNADPVGNLATNGGACPVEQSPGGLASAGPGVATYDSQALTRDFTMLGQTRVVASHTGTGPANQLNARLYDLAPDGEQVLVDRGVKRITSAMGPTTFDLHGAGWRFPSGHKLRLEVTQDDDTYIKVSALASSLTLSGVTMSVPVREASGTVGGGPAKPPAGPGGGGGPKGGGPTGGGSGASSPLPPCASSLRATRRLDLSKRKRLRVRIGLRRRSRIAAVVRKRGPRRWARTSLRKNAGRPLVTLRVSRRARPGRHRLKVRISCAGRRPQTVYRRVRFVP